jgi:alkyl hydroperoxide reductase subunit AhpC
LAELGQLEARHQDFEKRNTRIIGVSLEDRAEAAQSDAQFQHIMFLADKEGNLARAAELIGPQHAPDGGETNAPTTIVLDHDGVVRWVYRPDRYIHRLTPDELLAGIDAHLQEKVDSRQ